jgi:hypothetical protein
MTKGRGHAPLPLESTSLVLEIGWFLSKVEQDDTQGDGDGHMMVIKCPTWSKMALKVMEMAT